jgi:molybdopterin synthase catalytic subunit
MYNKRTWLNSDTSSSTGAVVAFDGKVTDLDTGVKYKERFLEISDCRHKITLHLTSDDSDEDFLNKMILLRQEIDEFIEYLKKEYV